MSSVRWFLVCYCRPLHDFIFKFAFKLCLPQFKLVMHLVKERIDIIIDKWSDMVFVPFVSLLKHSRRPDLTRHWHPKSSSLGEARQNLT